MFHWCVGGSSEAVLIRVRSFAAHFDSASQLSDFSKFGIDSGRFSPDSLLESSVLPSGRRAEGAEGVVVWVEESQVEDGLVVVMELWNPYPGVKVGERDLCLELIGLPACLNG